MVLSIFLPMVLVYRLVGFYIGLRQSALGSAFKFRLAGNPRGNGNPLENMVSYLSICTW